MDKCANCGQELTHTEGRRKKKFCTENCRIKFHYKNHPRSKKKPTASPKIEQKAALPKPPPVIVLPQQRPRNLDELRAMCPKELDGLDRSDWIRTNRQKYNI